MGGRGRPRNNQSKLLLIDRGIKESNSKEQGKQHAKGKMQEEELDLDSDCELNWPDLSCNRVNSDTPVNPSNLGMPRMNVTPVAIGDASTSRAKPNETVTNSMVKEQGNETMNIRAEEDRQNQTKPTNLGRSWAGLLQDNKLAAKGMDLTYIPPVIQEGEVVVQILEEDIAEEKQKWNRALIMYVVGNTPTIGAIERFVAAQWGKVRKPKVLYHSDGYFTILLNSVEERDEVLMNGPYTMNSRPIILKAWAEGFDFNEEVLKTIPLWVKFPKLPLNYWSNKALSKIGSGLGKSLYADACTTVADRISYARILIEIDITRTLPGTIKLVDPNVKVIEQLVQYDWKHQYCQTCCQIGHSCHNNEVQKQEMGQQTYGMQNQGKIWKVVRNLDPKTDKIDTRGRFLQQLEEVSDGIQSNNLKEENGNWQKINLLQRRMEMEEMR
uniref:Uncharacterized protein LOC104220956 n=1 Tax=Nicotiana sylvestris TaxID=4096 RepID=A0A1U7W6E7_NICSY|nr:PREDICTED: uncharacterized protein LOC104220956 [Nicotiana sylvestris]